MPCPSLYEGCVFKFYPRYCLVPSWIFYESDNVVWSRFDESEDTEATYVTPTSLLSGSHLLCKTLGSCNIVPGGDKRLEEGLKQNIYISVNPIFLGHSYRISCFLERYKPPSPGCTQCFRSDLYLSVLR